VFTYPTKNTIEEGFVQLVLHQGWRGLFGASPISKPLYDVELKASKLFHLFTNSHHAFAKDRHGTQTKKLRRKGNPPV
jgi:hypothetical protein